MADLIKHERSIPETSSTRPLTKEKLSVGGSWPWAASMVTVSFALSAGPPKGHLSWMLLSQLCHS